MKRGISLIVLVITIIVMIILAAAIIISISNSNVINKAGQAVSASDVANVKDAAALKYSDAKLGGISEFKTADYIENALIADNVISEANPYVFTNQGGAFLIPEYDLTSNTKSDYRVINNTLYYFGTDINKRISLKDNADINTDYITIGCQLMGQPTLTLNTLNGNDKIKSVRYIAKSKTDNAAPTSTTAITTGTQLYLQNNYTDKIATIIYYPELDSSGTIDSFDSSRATQLESGTYTLQSLYALLIDSSKYTLEEYKSMMNILLDVDLNEKVDFVDYELYAQAVFMINSGYNMSNPSLPFTKDIKNMNFYKTYITDISYDGLAYDAEEWENDYQWYLDYLKEIETAKTRKAYIDKTYDINFLMSTIPVSKDIFK